MKTNPEIVKSILLLIAAVVLLNFNGLELPYIDKSTDEYFTESVSKAGVAYGVCRIINASVSVIKESQIQVEPAGLGVTLAAGQVLDPLDDMTERASGILVTAIVSLGIQKVVYELSKDYAPPVIGILLILFVAVSYIKGSRTDRFRRLFLRFAILFAVLRLCLPASSIINSFLQENYFSPRILEASEKLTITSPELDRLKEMTMPEAEGVVDTVQSGFKFVKEKTSDLGEALKVMINNMGSMVSNLIKLSYLYVAIFVVQVILLPMCVFWIMTRLFNMLFGTGTGLAIKSSDEIRQE